MVESKRFPVRLKYIGIRKVISVILVVYQVLNEEVGTGGTFEV